MFVFSPWSLLLCVMRGSLSGPWDNGNAINPCAKCYMITNPGPPSRFLPVPRTRILSTIFEETHGDRNLYRWVVFVVWLKAHPEAWRWYRIIQKAHPHTVPSISRLWDECQNVWPLERKLNAGQQQQR